MNILQRIRNDIQYINTKLLTQEKTSTVLARMDNIAAEIVSLKIDNEKVKKTLKILRKPLLMLFNHQILIMILFEMI